MKNVFSLILSIIITILVPIVLVIGSIRIVLNPWYPKAEYRMPWFPDDLYGFTLAERDKYSSIAIEYLNTDTSIQLLMDLRFPSGQTAPPFSCLEMADCTQLYNLRELGHMIDVKYVLGLIFPIDYVSLGVLILIGFWARISGRWQLFVNSISRGGWLMSCILLTLVVLVIGVFDWFFTEFHNVFFSSGTWSFYTSDTLIRLFPERFWMDTFIIVGILAGIGGLIIILLGGWFQKRAH